MAITTSCTESERRSAAWASLPLALRLWASLTAGLSSWLVTMVFDWNSPRSLWGMAIGCVLEMALCVAMAIVSGKFGVERRVIGLALGYLGADVALAALHAGSVAMAVSGGMAGAWAVALWTVYLTGRDVDAAARFALVAYSGLVALSALMLWVDQSFHAAHRVPLGFAAWLAGAVTVGHLAWMMRLQRARVHEAERMGSTFGWVLAALRATLGPIGVILGAALLGVGLGAAALMLVYPFLGYVLRIAFRAYLRLLATSRGVGVLTQLANARVQGSPRGDMWVFTGIAIALCAAGIAVWAWKLWRGGAAEEASETGDTVQVTWVHERLRDSLRFVSTDHPVRLRYQRWLLAMDRRGLTIRHAETPRRFAMRVAEDGQVDEGKLTEAYEEVRYGRNDE
ncbi:DUF4129 domain-containing protein [Alicyclobacillus acidocaldarius]|uniref:Protein-glutamine gamma-glutamyltransferase-like C-terminal domain-containing protein n=1 Tax=Alicyclobacillus acidocaldarius subsp. acidocaldarius (strain ATCC 27009 / DSM 446 / BCRC 14685 / JCM 5260 / KCTC 1825 / NBRC 15652 / NCIMB 11725 / NRRL B-14509 / 104-IA) TaxID=521098 RepID=C8WUL3_ALIAD|nr:DUF4129 domain-containing protein [Alicyclobacillus acidocaldarius]ACV59829.1 hypothetical protein Aaci_2825 [Alicyclobacillus acidocaldarius subsp. acidocaldarius DSM 446]